MPARGEERALLRRCDVAGAPRRRRRDRRLRVGGDFSGKQRGRERERAPIKGFSEVYRLLLLILMPVQPNLGISLHQNSIILQNVHNNKELFLHYQAPEIVYPNV